MLGQISMLQDRKLGVGLPEWWVEVALPEDAWPEDIDQTGGASAMFYVYAPDRATAEAKLRAIGALLCSGAIENGMLTTPMRDEIAPSPETPF